MSADLQALLAIIIVHVVVSTELVHICDDSMTGLLGMTLSTRRTSKSTSTVSASLHKRLRRMPMVES